MSVCICLSRRCLYTMPLYANMLKHILLFLALASCSADKVQKNPFSIDLGYWNGDLVIVGYDPKSLNQELIDTLTLNFSKITISLGNKILFVDTSATTSYDLSRSQLIQYKDKAYLALFKHHPFDANLFAIINLDSPEKYVDVIASEVKDYDHDGILETGGSRIIESPCRRCDSLYYNPQVFYQFGEQLELDTMLSKSKTLEIFDVYLGLEPSDTILIRKIGT